MTDMKNINELSEGEEEEELEFNFKTSWCDQHMDSPWIFIGGLSYDLTQNNIASVFSQYGYIRSINLVRDKGNGKSRGFCFLCYEDQKSTVTAVKYLDGIKLLGRKIRVDHVAPPVSQLGKNKALRVGSPSVRAKRQRSTEESSSTETSWKDQKRTKWSSYFNASTSAQQSALVDLALQVVIMRNHDADPITEEEALLIKRLLIDEIDKMMYEPHPRRRPLQFNDSEYRPDPGWFVLSCCDIETRDWLLDWEPTTECRFVVRKSSEAPWSTRIIIAVGAEIDPITFVCLVDYQNCDIVGVDRWKFLGTEGGSEDLRAIFRVPSCTITWLETHNWRIHYELGTLIVWKALPLTAVSGLSSINLYKGDCCNQDSDD